MYIQWGQRAFLAEAINSHVGVLQRGNRTDGQRAKMEIVPAANKRAPLRSLSAAGGESSQAGAARIIGVVAPVNGSINIKATVKLGRV